MIISPLAGNVPIRCALADSQSNFSHLLFQSLSILGYLDVIYFWLHYFVHHFLKPSIVPVLVRKIMFEYWDYNLVMACNPFPVYSSIQLWLCASMYECKNFQVDLLALSGKLSPILEGCSISIMQVFLNCDKKFFIELIKLRKLRK